MPRPTRAPSTCAEPGCDAETMTTRCSRHSRRPVASSVERANSNARGYGRSWAKGPRADTLARDPVCTVCWSAPSTVADHHPTERVDLVAAGVADPDDLAYLRGCCATCHNTKSARRRRR